MPQELSSRASWRYGVTAYPAPWIPGHEGPRASIANRSSLISGRALDCADRAPRAIRPPQLPRADATRWHSLLQRPSAATGRGLYTHMASTSILTSSIFRSVTPPRDSLALGHESDRPCPSRKARLAPATSIAEEHATRTLDKGAAGPARLHTERMEDPRAPAPLDDGTGARTPSDTPGAVSRVPLFGYAASAEKGRP